MYGIQSVMLPECTFHGLHDLLSSDFVKLFLLLCGMDVPLVTLPSTILPANLKLVAAPEVKCVYIRIDELTADKEKEIQELKHKVEQLQTLLLQEQSK